MSESIKTLKQPFNCPMKKIEEFVPKNNYAEVASGQNHFWMAVINRNGKFIHKPMRCKDFLQDMVWKQKFGGSGTIYSFKAEQIPEDLWQYRVISFHPIVKQGDRIDNVRAFFNLPEHPCKIGVRKPAIEKADHSHFLAFDFSNLMDMPPHINSLYTCLIRLAPFFDAKKYGSVLEFLEAVVDEELDDDKGIESWDPGYLKITMPFLRRLFNEGKIYEDLQSWDKIKNSTIQFVHNSSGFVGFFSKNKTHEDFKKTC